MCTSTIDFVQSIVADTPCLGAVNIALYIFIGTFCFQNALAVLYNTSLNYMLGMENRSYLYLDDLSESQQKTVLDVVDRLKKEFLNTV